MRRLILLALVAAMVTPVLAADYDPQTPPGELIAVGDHQLHIYCQGERTDDAPAVVIDAGLGEWSLQWLPVAAGLAATTQVCVYDRAGYGWSEIGPAPRDGATIVAELVALLDGAGLTEPVVAVGHSLGGMHVRLLAAAHPDRVAGLVLVDSPHVEADQNQPPELRAWMEEQYADFPQFAEFAAQGFMEPELMPVPDYLPDDLIPLYQAQIATEGFFTALYDEYQALDTTGEQLAAIADFGDLPLVVIAAALPDTVEPDLNPLLADYHDAVWLPTQQQLAQQSSRGRYILADESQHHIQFDQPELIIAAIADLVMELAS